MRRQSNPNALVIPSGGVPGQAANRQQPEKVKQGNLGYITHEFQFDKPYFRCSEHRSFNQRFNYEVVKVEATDRSNIDNPITGTYQIINVPIDRLNQHLMTVATRLPNIRRITFNNPLSWEPFIGNFTPIMTMVLNILGSTLSLTRISLCADMLNDQLFHALSSRESLREIELLLPTVPFNSPNRLTQIGEVLNRCILQLPRADYYKFPLELINATLISCLGRSRSLRALKITGSSDAEYPGRFFIGCIPIMDYFQVPTPFFKNLRVLDVGDNQDFFSKETLTKMFPNTKFIKA